MDTTNERWWVAPALIIVAAGIFVYALTLAYQKDDKALFNVMCGASIVIVQGAFQWRFGSSKGSQDKDATTAERSKKQDETVAAATQALAVSSPPRP
jgi:hypothetical protein